MEFLNVKPKTPVKYKDTPYGIGQEFKIDAETYETNKDIFELVGPATEAGDKEAAKAKARKQLEALKMPKLIARAIEAGVAPDIAETLDKEDLIEAILAV